jgi:Uma2 family endonuclease
MVGGTLAHARVVRQIVTLIDNHLQGSGCEVFSESTKVTVDDCAAFLPDVFVTCTRTQPEASTVADAPVLIIEVVSPSTRGYDYSTKLVMYRRIPSLQQYVLVDPGERTVESYSRRPDGSWSLVDHTASGRVTLAPIDLELTSEQVFARLAA